ncbi:MAG: aspartate 1-decarboxylase [Planctomycetia bacterium]|nr:aspartate 1-decarboxylase [Planctomycetia bacterium]
MFRSMFKSKIHRATLTATKLDYEGSIAVDRDLLEAADMLPGEEVHVLNCNNGERLVTYLIEAPAGSGTGYPGDTVVLITYASMTEEEARAHKPTVVHVDEKNRMVLK